VLFGVGLGVETRAQTTGRIEGIVQAPDGVPISGAQVEAEGPRLLGVRRTITDPSGRYRLAEIPAGDYTVRLTVPGFREFERVVRVSLDAPVRLDVGLDVAVEETVSVSGEAPSIDLDTTTTGTSYARALVARLPVARNYADIARANPGVSTDKGETQGRSLALTVYGATSVENQWWIDGINTTNVAKGFQGKAINNEFVEELEVKSGGYQAEYGRALGGVVNVVTRSGGNAFHGDGFLYYDSAALRAEQVVIPDTDTPIGMKITPEERRDFGVDVGGYVLRDRLWFFGAYNRVETPGTTSRYFGTEEVPASQLFPRDQIDDLYSGKLTWLAARGTTLVATVFSDPSVIEGAALVGTGLPATTVITSPDPGTWESRRELGGADYGVRASQILGASAVVTAQASRHRDRFELFPSGAGEKIRRESWTCDGGTPENSCLSPPEPNASAGGIGLIDGNTQRTASIRDQFRGDATFFLGPHELKAGGDYAAADTTSVTSYTGRQLVRLYDEFGQSYFRHEFFVNRAGDPISSDLVDRARAVEKSAFVQDVWRISSGLTVNAGLRWDQEDLREARGHSVIHTTQWQPRLGIVWDPDRDGTTRIYAFAGRFAYSLPTDGTLRAFGSGLLQYTFNFSPTDLTPDSRVLNHPPEPPITLGAGELVDAGIGATYQDELTIGAERALAPTLVVGLKGTYRRLGRLIEDRCDLDPTAPDNRGFSCAFVNPGSNGKYASGNFDACNGIDPGYGDACFHGAEATPPARRVYEGIEVLARETIANRLWLQVSYAYSSLRGNVDGGVNQNFTAGQTDPGWNADFDYPPFWHQADGRLFLDRPHQARLDVSYTAPFGLFGGLGAYVQSGSPLNKRGYFNEVYGGANVFLVPRGGAGRMPTLWEANLTVGYPIVVGPVRVTLQAYLYNVFDNQLPTNQVVAYTAFQPPPGYPESLFDPNVPADAVNPTYGKIAGRQDPRLFRAAVRLSF
jgi:hypothetical protein